MLWSVSKRQCWDIRLTSGKLAKSALLSKPCFPLAKAGRIWFGVDVTDYAISRSRTLKCTCPTLTQQNGVTGMWSGEEGSRTSSGHWFPLCGLPPPRQTPDQLTAPQAATQPTPRAAQQGTQALLHPEMHPWVRNQPPRQRGPSLSAPGCWHMWIILLPSFWVISSHPRRRNRCPSAFPCNPLPPDPCHEQHFLILSRGPLFPAMSCYVWVQTLAFLVGNAFMPLSSWTWAQNSAGGDNCHLSFFFSVAWRLKGPPFASDSPARRQAQKELTSLSPCFEVSCFVTAKSLHIAMQRKRRGGSPSCCNTWSWSACVNKNYTPLLLELKTNRTTSLQPELNNHTAVLSGDWGTAHWSVPEIQAPSAAIGFSRSVYTAAVEGCTDQPTLTMLWE